MVISTDPAGESYTAHGGYTVFPPLSVCLRYASPRLDLPPTLIISAGCFVSIRLLTLTVRVGCTLGWLGVLYCYLFLVVLLCAYLVDSFGVSIVHTIKRAGKHIKRKLYQS